MAKIAILTLYGNNNFGNKLQNFALQKYLEDNFKCEVKTIAYNDLTCYMNEKSKKSYMIRNKIYDIKNRFKYKYNFKKFNKNIHYDKTIYSEDDIRELNNKYDFFVVGSDQVWSNEMTGNIENFMLPGIDFNKKYSYAASIGRLNVTKAEEEIFKKYLDGFSGVSVREDVSVETLKKLINGKVECHIDPTMLFSGKQWSKYEEKCKTPKNYMLLNILGKLSAENKKSIKQFAKENNLKIIDITKRNGRFSKIGPEKFIYLVHHAKIVFTDSFHNIVFSNLFNVPFIHVKRSDSCTDMSIRISNLERLFGYKFYTIDDIKNNKFEFGSNQLDIEKKLEVERKLSHEYFKNMLQEKKLNNNLLDKNIFCSGCGLCKNVCPVKAITYKEDEQGFIKPVIDEKKCVHCGKCVSSCTAIHNFEKPKFDNIYALKNKISLNDKSSSAGVFGTLARKILEEGGVVFGAKYDKEKNDFIKVENLEDLPLIQGSKYYQFNITKVYGEIEKELTKNRKVLVCGTPCQISALHAKFGENENLVLTQIICHGVPSFKLFKRYCDETFGEMPDSVNFKFNDGKSWLNYSTEFIVKNKRIVTPMKTDVWMRVFLTDIALNDSCYNCNYSGKNTGADMIIGDCWSIKKIKKSFYDGRAVSIVSVNSQKGNEIFSKIQNNFEFYKIPNKKLKYCNINMIEKVNHEKHKLNHYKFLSDCQNQSLKEVVENNNVRIRFKDLSFKQKIKRIIKKILKKFLGE